MTFFDPQQYPQDFIPDEIKRPEPIPPTRINVPFSDIFALVFKVVIALALVSLLIGFVLALVAAPTLLAT